MTLNQQELQYWADRLHDALVDGVPVEPPTSRVPELGVTDAYAIQSSNRRRAEAEGALTVGRKIGLTSEPMQRLLGVDEPDFGFVLDSMVVPEGASLSMGAMCAPRVEPEIAFRLARPLHGKHVTCLDVLEATDCVAAAIEVVDSRIVDWRISLPDTIADNASSGAVVLGPWVPLVDAPDLETVHAKLAINGTPVQEGVGSAVLGHPAAAVAWLARALSDMGEGLETGMVILSGAITSAPAVHRGDSVSAAITGLGEVGVSFT